MMNNSKSYILGGANMEWGTYSDTSFVMYAEHVKDLYQQICHTRAIDIDRIEDILDRLDQYYNAITLSLSQEAIQRIDEVYAHRQMMWHGTTGKASGETPRYTDDYLVKDRIADILSDTLWQAKEKKWNYDMDQQEQSYQNDKKIFDKDIPLFLMMTIVVSLLGTTMTIDTSLPHALWLVSSTMLLSTIKLKREAMKPGNK